MAWYLIVYLVLFGVVSIAGILEDLHSRRPLAFVAGMVVALIVGILSVLAFGLGAFGNALGVWLWALLAVGVSMEVVALVWDLRDLSQENDTSRSEAVVITLVVVAITLPAYALGAVAAVRPGS